MERLLALLGNAVQLHTYRSPHGPPLNGCPEIEIGAKRLGRRRPVVLLR